VSDMSNPGSARAALIFLAFAVIGLIAGGALGSFVVSNVTSILIDPSKVRDGTLFLYFFFVFMLFAAVPVAISGLFVAMKHYRGGYPGGRYAMLVAFLASGLSGFVYLYLYGGDDPNQRDFLKAILLSYLIIGPVAAFCALLGQRAAWKLKLLGMRPAVQGTPT